MSSLGTKNAIFHTDSLNQETLFVMAGMRERYGALNLRVLNKVNISNAAWVTLARGFIDPEYKKFNTGMFILAEFKQAAADEVMAWAQKQTEPLLIRSPVEGLSLLEDYECDIDDLNYAIFGSRGCKASHDIGTFQGTKAGYMHADIIPKYQNEDMALKRIWICRLGALETIFICKERIRKMNSLQRRLVGKLLSQTRNKSMNSKALEQRKNVKETLIKMGAAVALPLSSVGLMLPCDDKGRGGIDHCSSDLPVRNNKPVPTPSALLYVMAA